MATIIDGNATAAIIRQELKLSVEELQQTLGVTPGLAVILVGERRDSATYVRAKKKACSEIGIISVGIDYPATVSQEELLAKIDQLNADPLINGILVQLPIPPHIDEATILNRIHPSKDVDGLHPLNVASLAKTQTHAPGRNSFSFDAVNFHVSCTPQGCIELLDRYGVEISGKDAVVIGRSNIVGIPVALLLMHRNATVTIAHSRTKDIASVIGRADIVVAAVGRAEMVRGEWLKPGAVVIDVGINSVDDASKKTGYRLVGDVNFTECKEVASQITPVPGGVGPMTIAMLLRNTVNGCRRAALVARALPPVPSASVCSCEGAKGLTCNCGENCKCEAKSTTTSVATCSCGGAGGAACNCGSDCNCAAKVEAAPVACSCSCGVNCKCGDNCTCSK